MQPYPKGRQPTEYKPSNIQMIVRKILPHKSIFVSESVTHKLDK